MADTQFLQTLRDDLSKLEQQGRLRRLRSWRERNSREVELDGRLLLNVSSNDYLALANDPRIVQAGIDAARRYGWGAGASRLIIGNAEPYDRLESALSRHKGTDAALVFTSGYQANLGLLAGLVEPGEVVIMDELGHASLWDACKVARANPRVFRHNDADDLERLLRRHTGGRGKLVLTEGVFSMDGDVAPLPALLEVCERHGALLVVDDAHGYGVLGPLGAGTAAAQGIAPNRFLSMGTLSKALGGLGGYIAGPREIRDTLLQKARSLIYTTGLPPAVAAAAGAAVELLPQLEPARTALLARAARLRQGIQALGYGTGDSQTQIVPVMAGEDRAALALMAKLLERDILAVAIRPPTVPSGTARLRVSLTAAHTDADVARVLDALSTV